MSVSDTPTVVTMGVADGYKVHIRVNRPIYTQQAFNQKYINQSSTNELGRVKKKQSLMTVFNGLRDRIKSRCSSPSAGFIKKRLLSFFPFIRIMKSYNVRTDLPSDIMSGLIVGIMHIPQGMAYGMLTKLDPVFGLYASFFPVICYFFFGTSKHISIGTFAVVSLMIGKVVEQSDCADLESQTRSNSSFTSDNYSLPDGNYSTTEILSREGMSEYQKCQIGVAMSVSFVVGVLQILLGVCRFGFVAVYLSDPLTRALTMSAAIHVATSQIKHMFGIDMGRFSGPFKLIYMYMTLFQNILHTNVAALVTCIIAMIIIYTVQRWVSPRVKEKIKMPVPIELIVIIISTLIAYLAQFESRFMTSNVGHIPIGFSSVATDAVGIAIVAFTINISMAKLFAKKHNYSLDSNQELLAYGIANVTCSMLNCYVSTASLSRSLVQESAGGKTQVAGLVSCSLLLVVLLAIAPLFYELPKSILAAIVLVNLRGIIMQITDLKTLYKNAQYYDLIIWIVTAVAVILTDVDTGLYIGVGFSLLTVVFRTQRPHTSLLGRIPHTDFYEDIRAYPLAQEIPGIKVFRFTASLYYANSEHFTHKLYRKTGCNPGEIRAGHKRQVALAEREKLLEVKKQKLMKLEMNQVTAKDDTLEKNGLTNEVSPGAAFINDSDDAANQTVVEVLLPSIKNVILDFSMVVFIDQVGVSALQQIVKDYKDIGVRVSIACCSEDVYEKLEKAGLLKKSDNCTLFVGVHDAVLAAVESDSSLQDQMRTNAASVLGSVFDVSSNAVHSSSDAESPVNKEDSFCDKFGSLH